jgi:hypothetical protein
LQYYGADVTVADVKEKLQTLEEIPSQQLVLMHAGKELEDDSLLVDLGLTDYNRAGDTFIELQVWFLLASIQQICLQKERDHGFTALIVGYHSSQWLGGAAALPPPFVPSCFFSNFWTRRFHFSCACMQYLQLSGAITVGISWVTNTCISNHVTIHTVSFTKHAPCR